MKNVQTREGDMNAMGVFALCGGNPANELTFIVNAKPRIRAIRGEDGIHRSVQCPELDGFSAGRLRVAAALLATMTRPVELELWALCESLNNGSAQRTLCPLDSAAIEAAGFKGSGRWLAGDNGGDYGSLRRILLAWINTPESYRKLFQAIADRLDIPVLVSAIAAAANEQERERARLDSVIAEAEDDADAIPFTLLPTDEPQSVRVARIPRGLSTARCREIISAIEEHCRAVAAAATNATA